MSINSILAALQNIPPLRRTRVAGKLYGFRPQLVSLDGRITPSFSPAVNYSVGSGPIDVATGDFNNDDRLDLVTANHWDNTVSVRLGDGQGGFGPANNLTVGSNPRSVAIGDFNGDTIDDISTANGGSGDVSVLLSNENGTFQTAVSTNLNLGPYDGPVSLAEGDFNADGKMDLAVGASVNSYYYGYYTSGYVGVLLSDGAGGFNNSSGWNYVGDSPSDLVVGQLNGDNKLDVVTAGSWGYVSVLLGNDSGGLNGANYFNTGSGYNYAVEVGHFTGDGNLDVAVAGEGLCVLPGTVDGSFGLPVSTSTFASLINNLATADFNGDGKMDLAATDANTVMAFLGAGDGSFNAPTNHAVGYAYGVVAGTFNVDGLPDVAVCNLTSNTVSVLVNDGVWPAVTPRMAIGDVSVGEGNTGTVEAKFVVTLSTSSLDPITVQFTTANDTASSGTDYQSAASTLTFAPGEVSKTITILVNGDRLGEAATESFFINLSNATNASIYDSQGVGTIVDNEPRISINDVSAIEGNGKSTIFTFTVTLSAAYDQAVTVNFATQNGTANSGSDYQSKSGTVTFLPGETSKTITITVYGDKKREANETFFVNLFAPSTNAWLFDPQGKGTILDDDRRL